VVYLVGRHSIRDFLSCGLAERELDCRACLQAGWTKRSSPY
jgi:hypothetical protein